MIRAFTYGNCKNRLNSKCIFIQGKNETDPEILLTQKLCDFVLEGTTVNTHTTTKRGQLSIL